MTISVQEYKGKQIIVIDNTGLSSAGLIAGLEEVTKLILKTPGKARLLSKFHNAAVGPDYMARAKELGKLTTPRTEKQAIVGVDGLKLMLLKAYVKFTGADIKVCQTDAEALDYLAA